MVTVTEEGQVGLGWEDASWSYTPEAQADYTGEKITHCFSFSKKRRECEGEGRLCADGLP